MLFRSKLKVTEKAPVGKDVSFKVVGAATFNDRNYKFKTGDIKLVVAAPVDVAGTPPPPAAGGAAK